MKNISELSASLFYDLVTDLYRHSAPVGEWDKGLILETATGKKFSADAVHEELEKRQQDFWVELRPVSVNTDPPLTVYQITVWRDGSTWDKSYGSAIEVEAFFEGLQAALFKSRGTIFTPPIPKALYDNE